LGKDKVRFSQPARANDLLIYNTTCTKHPLGSSTRLDFRACKVYTQLIGVDIRSNTSMWDFRRTVGGLLATAKNLRRSNR
jgi:acyl dehydratase